MTDIKLYNSYKQKDEATLKGVHGMRTTCDVRYLCRNSLQNTNKYGNLKQLLHHFNFTATAILKESRYKLFC